MKNAVSRIIRQSVSIALFGLLLTVGCSNLIPTSLTALQADSVRVVTADQLRYVPLNPARGDRSPQAGVLWGDIRKDEASGTLLRFADGFSSPPHIHNITYRAVVISGEIHNDDPEAAMLWMDPGSFWIQPAGEVHITAAKPGRGGTAFLEILTGPYLVQPSTEAFDDGERPLNLLRDNIVWMSAEEFRWLNGTGGAEGVQAALLWGDLRSGAEKGLFLMMPADYRGMLRAVDHGIRSVVVKGGVEHQVAGVTELSSLMAGGFFESAAGVEHSLSCRSASPCLLYVRTQGAFEVR
ncbi:MAG: DUF4437 domain-containing protein [Pseudomonadota bacterium]